MSLNIDYDALAKAIIAASSTVSTPLAGAVNGEVKVGGVALLASGANEAGAVVDGKVGLASGGVGAVGTGEDCVAETSSDSGASVSGGVPGKVSNAVKRVKFGGLADGASSVVPFYASYVRSESGKAMSDFAFRYSGFKMPKAAGPDLALCCFVAGTVPAAFVNGKERLRSLAAVGDAVLTAHVAVHCMGSGQTVESAQNVRSRVVSDASLRAVAERVGLFALVQSGVVDMGTSKAGATAFEAVVGVLALYRPAAAVQQFLFATGVLVK